MSRKNKQKQPNFVALYRHTIKSPAWRAMSVGARAAYVLLASNYNTRMQNAVYLSVRTGSKELGVNKDTVTKWLHELEFYGFIALVQHGSIGVYGYGRATQYRLTDRPHAGAPPTQDFQKWAGEIFEPKKQDPVRLSRTPCPKKPDIEKSVPTKTLCPIEPDIETATDCPGFSDITSLAISQRSKSAATAHEAEKDDLSIPAVLRR
jgi:hypothetical protein